MWWLKRRVCASAFFALLLSIMIPPNMPVQLFIFVSVRISRAIGKELNPRAP